MKNRHEKILGFIILISLGILILSGCQSEKIIHLAVVPCSSLKVNQKLATDTNPPEFYLCDSEWNSCSAITSRWSGEEEKYTRKKSKHKSGNRSQLSTIKVRKNTHENIVEKNNCIFK